MANADPEPDTPLPVATKAEADYVGAGLTLADQLADIEAARAKSAAFYVEGYYAHADRSLLAAKEALEAAQASLDAMAASLRSMRDTAPAKEYYGLRARLTASSPVVRRIEAAHGTWA